MQCRDPPPHPLRSGERSQERTGIDRPFESQAGSSHPRHQQDQEKAGDGEPQGNQHARGVAGKVLAGLRVGPREVAHRSWNHGKEHGRATRPPPRPEPAALCFAARVATALEYIAELTHVNPPPPRSFSQATHACRLPGKRAVG